MRAPSAFASNARPVARGSPSILSEGREPSRQRRARSAAKSIQPAATVLERSRRDFGSFSVVRDLLPHAEPAIARRRPQILARGCEESNVRERSVHRELLLSYRILTPRPLVPSGRGAFSLGGHRSNRSVSKLERARVSEQADPFECRISILRGSEDETCVRAMRVFSCRHARTPLRIAVHTRRQKLFLQRGTLVRR